MPSQSPSLPFDSVQACLHGRECVHFGQQANMWFYTYSSMLCPQRVPAFTEVNPFRRSRKSTQLAELVLSWSWVIIFLWAPSHLRQIQQIRFKFLITDFSECDCAALVIYSWFSVEGIAVSLFDDVEIMCTFFFLLRALAIRREPDALHHYGAMLFNLRRVSEAEKLYREALQIDPDRVETALHLVSRNETITILCVSITVVFFEHCNIFTPERLAGVGKEKRLPDRNILKKRAMIHKVRALWLGGHSSWAQTSSLLLTTICMS